MSAAVDTIATRTRTPGLAAGLVEAQRAAKAVAKEATNSFHKYKYASSEDVIEAARYALSVGDLALFADSATLREIIPGYGEGENYEPPMFVVAVTYSLVHTSGESHRLASETPVIPEKGRPFDKALAAAKTHDLSYTLRSLLLLPRGTDDGDVDARDDRQRDAYDRGRATQREAPPMTQPAPRVPKPEAPPPVSEPTKPAAGTDELRQWWQALQALGLGGDDIKALAHDLFGAEPRALTKGQRAGLYDEAARRKSPAVDSVAKELLDEARGGAR
jgi:hypothetical protein